MGSADSSVDLRVVDVHVSFLVMESIVSGGVSRSSSRIFSRRWARVRWGGGRGERPWESRTVLASSRGGGVFTIGFLSKYLVYKMVNIIGYLQDDDKIMKSDKYFRTLFYVRPETVIKTGETGITLCLINP